MVSPGLAASQQLRGAAGAVAGRVLKYQGANQVWALGGHHGGCGRAHRVPNQDRFKARSGGGLAGSSYGRSILARSGGG